LISREPFSESKTCTYSLSSRRSVTVGCSYQRNFRRRSRCCQKKCGLYTACFLKPIKLRQVFLVSHPDFCSIQDEIEVVLRYPGQSWAAIGWKPQNTECPHYTPQFEQPGKTATNQHTLQRVEIKKAEPDATSTSVTAGTVRPTESSAPITTIETSTTPATNATSSEDCGPNEQWSSCPETSRDCEPSCDWTRFPETIPNCPRSCGSPRCICKEGFVRMTNEEEACVPFDFCDKEADHSCPANSTWAKCGTACEPSCANMYDTAPCPATCEKSACTCADNYVRHEGKCIYWGDCPDIDSHFHDAKKSTEVTGVPAVSGLLYF
ncbi:trypsin Inhibitor like cysteine rich domain protein, partial [Ancylostoma caninum]